MAKLLYIKANPKSNQSSRTFIISEHFIKVYKEFHPNDQIITLDLYKEGIHFLSQEDINDIFAPKTEASKHHHILKYAYQFAEADKYVFAAPMWNLGIPAILKAYIDYITVSGITFKYTEQGAVGLLRGKKAVHIMATGGEYKTLPFSDFEMANRYLKTILGFMGVEDFKTITAQRLDIVGEDVEKIMFTALKEAEEIAKGF
ncbi:FMN-dependent NADH-azoreductase [Caldicellulosiruptor bescii]|uniref:FMN-dependent NADH:quinone oxidoreductase n=2 Tax=Caldicellulosiruptor bescii TaxID=31899 RepID=AZOR_CALBD|nr:NAD(P)H-dependent oxidoreductase [Caldicellulosiruptor bescii]B9MQS8.1 RecName: Full=FMN-dependent NADH:quinone oxidoreductase; AltName: Full=Azo-dye reductase; AltName: Full=FMN-dependent NADH-azo compound oxidoreductase; AltName: Full=FMN-dependent NADH-azoreductase [Caldicellulosiruptor bescii DSM 6725]ACM60032.1 NAD(P)H dehydrogenase (quinone) [Caldicellulosiruptor bescii DSM 6725]PBC87445.1 FMN-dependent NADH-azoreductase [Caldicellulosiruptor bescii]PBC90378.1 FMN-dependent NADH-azored